VLIASSLALYGVWDLRSLVCGGEFEPGLDLMPGTYFGKHEDGSDDALYIKVVRHVTLAHHFLETPPEGPRGRTRGRERGSRPYRIRGPAATLRMRHTFTSSIWPLCQVQGRTPSSGA
jgi:hypothetical protein